MGKKPGTKTDLTKERSREIRRGILDGLTIKETAERIFKESNNLSELGEEGTIKGMANLTQKIYNWKCDNYLNLNDKIENWKMERKIRLATKNLEGYLQMETKKKVFLKDKELEIEEIDPTLEKIKADMTKFTLETLNKKHYSKRVESTGPDGRDLFPDKETAKKIDDAIDDVLNNDKEDTTI